MRLGKNERRKLRELQAIARDTLVTEPRERELYHWKQWDERGAIYSPYRGRPV
jgi:hypothetical protein